MEDSFGQGTDPFGGRGARAGTAGTGRVSTEGSLAMGARFSRLVSAVAAGGVLTGALLVGGGVASAASGETIDASCGDTVTASPGDTVRVKPLLGAAILVPITDAAPLQPITRTLAGVLCQVQVKVLLPVTSQVAKAAPPLKPVTDAVSGAGGAVLDPKPAPASASRQAAATPAPQAVTPVPAAPPAMSPAAIAAAAPAFAPAFTALPSSFVGAAAPVASPGGLRTYDAGALFGSAFPGLRAGAPAYLGYDPASAVTTASQVQALPVDGLSGGLGVPVMLAVLAMAGVAAFVVRAMVLRRAAAAVARAEGAASSGPAGEEETTDAGLAPVAGGPRRATPAPVSPAVGFPALASGTESETEFVGTVAR